MIHTIKMTSEYRDMTTPYLDATRITRVVEGPKIQIESIIEDIINQCVNPLKDCEKQSITIESESHKITINMKKR